MGLDKIIPKRDLAVTLLHALLDELRSGLDLDSAMGGLKTDIGFVGITGAVARLLDWLVRHDPLAAARCIQETQGEAYQQFEMPYAVTEESVKTALMLDGELDAEAFYSWVFDPYQQDQTPEA